MHSAAPTAPAFISPEASANRSFNHHLRAYRTALACSQPGGPTGCFSSRDFQVVLVLKPKNPRRPSNLTVVLAFPM